MRKCFVVPIAGLLLAGHAAPASSARGHGRLTFPPDSNDPGNPAGHLYPYSTNADAVGAAHRYGYSPVGRPSPAGPSNGPRSSAPRGPDPRFCGLAGDGILKWVGRNYGDLIAAFGVPGKTHRQKAGWSVEYPDSDLRYEFFFDGRGGASADPRSRITAVKSWRRS